MRRLGLPTLCLIFCLFWAAPALAAQPMLRLDLPANLDCPRTADLLTALAERFGPESLAEGRAGGGELGLSIVQFPDALELELSEGPGAPPTRRWLPFTEGSCGDMAQTITLLVDAWVRDLRDHRGGVFGALVAEPAEPTVPVASATPAASPAPAAVQPPAPATFGPGALNLWLGGGGSIGGDGSELGPEARLSADLTLYRRFGVALLASALEDTAVQDEALGGGTISTHRQTLSLAGRYSLVGDEATGLRLFVGLALQTFEAHSSDFSNTTANVEVVPGVLLSALWQQHLYKRLSAFAQLAATVGPETDFTITYQDANKVVLAVPAATFDLTAGLALRLF